MQSLLEAAGVGQYAAAVDEEGYLVAQSDFTEPVGPTYWERDHKDIGDQGEADL